MNRSFLKLVLLAFVLFSPALLMAQTFEGEITMQMSSPMLGNQKIDLISSIKGDKILQSADDPHQGRTSIYTDNKAGVQVIVQEALKVGKEMDISVIDQAIKMMKLPPMVPKKAGKEDVIAGYKSELYTMMVDSVEEMNIWLTKDFPKDVAEGIRSCVYSGMMFSGIKSDALLALFKAGYAPVRLEMKQNGMVQFSNEFFKAEHKKLNDAIFVVPQDIKIEKFDPSALGADPNSSGQK